MNGIKYEPFTSKLSKDSQKELKKMAADKDKKIYEVLEEIVVAAIKAQSMGNKKAIRS